MLIPVFIFSFPSAPWYEGCMLVSVNLPSQGYVFWEDLCFCIYYIRCRCGSYAFFKMRALKMEINIRRTYILGSICQVLCLCRFCFLKRERQAAVAPRRGCGGARASSPWVTRGAALKWGG